MTSGASTGVTTYTTPSDREVVPAGAAGDDLNRAIGLLDELVDTQR